MKHSFILAIYFIAIQFTSVISTLHASAQDIDTLQVQPAAISIDSLSLRLENLQHDYDFLSCDYNLNMLKMDLNNFSQDISIKTSEVIADINSNRYDRDYYKLLLEHYDACCTLYDNMKVKIEAVQASVMIKLLSSNFSDEELNVIYAYFGPIQQNTKVIDSALSYYDFIIQ